MINFVVDFISDKYLVVLSYILKPHISFISSLNLLDFVSRHSYHLQIRTTLRTNKNNLFLYKRRYQLLNISYLIFIANSFHLFFANIYFFHFYVSKSLNLFYILGPSFQYFCFRLYILLGLLCLLILARGNRFLVGQRHLYPRKCLGKFRRSHPSLCCTQTEEVISRVEMPKYNSIKVNQLFHSPPPLMVP